MDSLCVAASVTGLLLAGAQLVDFLELLISGAQDAQILARHLLDEINGISAALGHLQPYFSGREKALSRRTSLILLEHVTTSLTGCVTTYSDLQRVFDDLNFDPEKGVLERARWHTHQGTILAILRHLQDYKTCMMLLATIMQCNSLQEAQRSADQLHDLIQEVLQGDKDLAAQINGIQSEGFLITAGLQSSVKLPEAPVLRVSVSAESLRAERRQTGMVFTLKHYLQGFRAHRRASAGNACTSVTYLARSSPALHTTSDLPVCSKLSLSQVSALSFFALPVHAGDLANSAYYVFGGRVEPATAQSRPWPVTTRPLSGWIGGKMQFLKLGKTGRTTPTELDEFIAGYRQTALESVLAGAEYGHYSKL